MEKLGDLERHILASTDTGRLTCAVTIAHHSAEDTRDQHEDHGTFRPRSLPAGVSAMTSAPRPNYWILEFEAVAPAHIEPLMGYTSSDDPYRPIRLKFPDRESAVDFAEGRTGIMSCARTLGADGEPRAGETRHRLHRASMPGSLPGPVPPRSPPLKRRQHEHGRRLPATGEFRSGPRSLAQNPSPPLILRRGRV